MKYFILFFALLNIFCGRSWGACAPEDSPEIEKEYRDSKYIVVGDLIGDEKHIIHYYADDENYNIESGELLSVRVIEPIKGSAKRNTVLYFHNFFGTAKFGIDSNASYLLFVKEVPENSVLYVYNCGSSGPVSQLDEKTRKFLEMNEQN